MSAPTASRATARRDHRGLCRGGALGSIGDADGVPFVAHHAAYRHAARTSQVRDTCRVVRPATAPRHPDIHVDEHLADACARGGGDRCIRVDRDGDTRAALGHGAQTRGIDALIGEEQVVAETGGGHSEDLARRRGREAVMAALRLFAREGGASCVPSRAGGGARRGARRSSCPGCARARRYRPRARGWADRRRASGARMAREPHARRGATANRSRLAHRRAAADCHSATSSSRPSAGSRRRRNCARSVPISASRSWRTSAASGVTSCGALGPAVDADARYMAIASDDLDRAVDVPALRRRPRRGHRPRRERPRPFPAVEGSAA